MVHGIRNRLSSGGGSLGAHTQLFYLRLHTRVVMLKPCYIEIISEEPNQKWDRNRRVNLCVFESLLDKRGMLGVDR